jgi:acyl-CoA synthetase (AMP-forming)/AMP-acid ligase II
VEDIVKLHPAVRDAIVVGAPHEHWGQQAVTPSETIRRNENSRCRNKTMNTAGERLRVGTCGAALGMQQRHPDRRFECVLRPAAADGSAVA